MSTLVFPGLNELKLAITAGLLPHDLLGSPVQYRCDEDGSWWVSFKGKIDTNRLNQLNEFGIRRGRQPKTLQNAVCWPEMIPPVAQSAEPNTAGMVLFKLEDSQSLLDFAAELLRLGCDRISYCSTVQNGGGVLIRVVQPPLFSLYKAQDRIGGLQAYVATPAGQESVWTQIGFAHDFVENIHAPDRSLIVITEQAWEFLADGPWTSLYDALDISMASPRSWQSVDPVPPRVPVSLRFSRKARTENPELWILRVNAVDGMERLLNQLPEADINRLQVAVCTAPNQADRPAILLKTRNRHQSSTLGDIGGESYAPWLGLENLYIPSDAVLKPPLRRDKLQSLFAADPDVISIMREDDQRRLGLESIPVNAFSPLEDWVDYVIHSRRQELVVWARAACFDFDGYESSALEWQQKALQDKNTENDHHTSDSETAGAATRPQQVVKSANNKLTAGAPPVEPVVIEVGDEEKQLLALEKDFVESGCAVDHPRRAQMWLQMAQLNQSIGQHKNAMLCWVRALWLQQTASYDLPWAVVPAGQTEESWVKNLGDSLQPNQKHVRDMATGFICGYTPQHGTQDIQRWIDVHDECLDVRSLWLLHCRLSELSGVDKLRLIRTRDRIFARLHHGLSLDRDVPVFLRFGGRQLNDTGMRLVVDALHALWKRFQNCKRQRSPLEADTTLTSAYTALLFAWAFARFGESETAGKLQGKASSDLPTDDAVHHYLMRCYQVRIQQALQAIPREMPLPATLSGELNKLDKLQRYKVDRLRQASLILESQERLDPISGFLLAGNSEGDRQFSQLRGIQDPVELGQALDTIIDKALAGGPCVETSAWLDRAMDFFPLLGDAMAIEKLLRLLGHIDACKPAEQLHLLEDALMLAALFNREDMVSDFVQQVEGLLDKLPREARQQAGKILFQSTASLRRVGLLHQGMRIVRKAEQLFAGSDVASLIARMPIAQAYAELDNLDKATSIIDEATSVLEKTPMQMQERLQLHRAVALAVGYLPLQAAFDRFAILERQLPMITDNFNTNSHFSLSVLHFMESLVLAMANEKLAMGEQGKKWLDEDEWLVRRRIQHDLQAINQ